LAEVHKCCPSFVILGGHLLSPIFILLAEEPALWSGVDSAVTVSHNVDGDVVLVFETSTHLRLHLWVLRCRSNIIEFEFLVHRGDCGLYSLRMEVILMKARKMLVALGLSVVLFLTGSNFTVNAASNEVGSVSITHAHVSDATNGGGCYITPHIVSYGTKNVNVTCGGSYGGGTATGGTIGGKPTYTYTCTRCGNVWTGWAESKPSNCDKVTGTRKVCKKCGSSSCNGDHQEGYDLACGMTDGQVLGTYTLVKQDGKDYTLSVVTDTGSLEVKSYKWNDGSTGSSYAVKSDGSYSCVVTVNDGYADRIGTLSYTVTDYDKEPPVIGSVTYNKDRTKNPVDIVVVATDEISGVAGYMIEKK